MTENWGGALALEDETMQSNVSEKKLFGKWQLSDVQVSDMSLTVQY